jgi:hypothetical protein
MVPALLTNIMSSPPSFPRNYCAQTCVFVFVNPARYLCRRKGLCASQFTRFRGLPSKVLRGYNQAIPSIRPTNSHSPTSFGCHGHHMFHRLQPTGLPSFYHFLPPVLQTSFQHIPFSGEDPAFYIFNDLQWFAASSFTQAAASSQPIITSFIISKSVPSPSFSCSLVLLALCLVGTWSTFLINWSKQLSQIAQYYPPIGVLPSLASSLQS